MPIMHRFYGKCLLASCLVFGLAACDGGGASSGDVAGLPIGAADVAGQWTMEIDTSEAARSEYASTAGLTVSVMPSASSDPTAPVDEDKMIYEMDFEFSDDNLTRCTAKDVAEGMNYVTVQCHLENNVLVVRLGSAEQGGTVISSLVRQSLDGPISGKTVMSASGLPMDVVMGKATLLR
ncbi:hypothetical protein JCM17846_21790 [Iodidimonas nitroreducens]|uniref:Lipoprotein n=1 Tax=Iodidimonas nitroreducens TaxID=1236968 RepID=A0A5A7N9A1_9PROT|nr:hypothetical protein AQ1_00464 [alpha proteobacterium Q-1]GER04497.1 hypothetical protein JCM17846_21790 [Iodidimonas nitroreducens]